jgi:ABC-2 type transport system ATP-binding protein
LGQRIRSGERAPWAAVGYLAESADAYPELTVRENLEVMRRLRPGVERKAVNQVLDRLALAGYADRRAGTLSHGNKQRLGLAKALLHTPALLILDEPANGLDPAGIVEIRNLLLELVREQGVTVFMSSHLLGEVARLAQRIGVIHRGRLLQELDSAELERNRRRWLRVRTRDLDAARAVLQQAGFAPTTADGTITLQDQVAVAHPDEIAAQLCRAGHPPTLLAVEEEDLERYFLRLVGADGESPHA